MLKKKEPFLVGVAGGISSGKSSVCKKIISELSKLNNQHPKHILVISLDSFYKRLSPDEMHKAERGELNLDHPSAFDEDLAVRTLNDLMQGKRVVEIPIYDKKSYRIVSHNCVRVTPDDSPDILILEGILIFYFPKIREMCQMKLFVDCDADTRLSRRVLRDMNEYERPLDNILTYYQKYVKPTFEEFCLPTKKYADVIIPRGAENLVAINLIVQHLNEYLNNANSTNSSGSSSSSSASPSIQQVDDSSNHNDSNNDSSSNLGGDSGMSVSTPVIRSPISSNSSLLHTGTGLISPNRSHTDISTRPH